MNANAADLCGDSSGLRHCGKDSVGKLRGACRAAYVAGEGFALGINGVEGPLHLVSRGLLVKVAQHQHRGLEQSSGVGHVLAGNVRG